MANKFGSLLLLGALVAVANAACTPRICASTNFTMGDSACQLTQDNTLYLRVCKGGYTCNTNTGYCNFAPDLYTSAGFANINEACTYTIDCLHGATCVKGHCQGKAKGEDCTSDLHCNKGLYCNGSGQCQEMIDVGMGDCGGDNQCVPQAGCNATYSDTDGKCVQLYTAKPGTPVAYCSAAYADHNLCQSGKCWRTSGRRGQCASFIKNSKSTSNSTDTAYTCTSTCKSEADPLNQNTAESDCQCSDGTKGNQYCTPFPGDKPAKDYLDLLALWTASDAIKNCNARNDPGEPTSCMKTWWDPVSYAKFKYYKMRYDNWAKIQDNDQCIRQIYTGAYWESLAAYEDALASNVTGKVSNMEETRQEVELVYA